MNGTFNGQILVEKLARLNNSQQSIETLSHWCIFHMNKAKQVVETWDRQFHCSPREQRLPFLYLANDILQNSRRKGSEFVAEFWKVLPDALSDVIQNGGESAKSSAMRLITIWEERKVFGSRGKILKEEFVGKNVENTNKNGKGLKLKQSIGNILEKIISGYEVVYDGPLDEEALLSKCRAAIGCVDKIEKEIGSDISSARLDGPELVELQGQHGVLRECIEQLRSAESSRETLLSHLREALQEQEFKLDEVRSQLQVAQSQSERVGNICQQILNCKSGQLADQTFKETKTFSGPPGFIPDIATNNRDKEQSAPVMYTQRAPSNNSYVEDDPRKSAAAAVAAKLAASTSSAQMLSFVLNSLASEGVLGNQTSQSSSEHPPEKRQKFEISPSYQPATLLSQPPLPPFPHPDTVQHMGTASSPPSMPHEPPPPPSSSPMQPPPPPPLSPVSDPPTQPSPQIMQPMGMPSGPYSYSTVPQRPVFPSYSMVVPQFPAMPTFPSPPNPYLNYQVSEGGFYSQPPVPASPPISRQ